MVDTSATTVDRSRSSQLPSALKAVATVLGVSGFFLGLAFLGAGLSGSGDGTAVFLEALFAPFPLSTKFAFVGFGLWPVIGVLLALRQIQGCRIAVAAILVVHYVGIVIRSRAEDWSYAQRVWTDLPGVVVLIVIPYLCSQILFWFLIVRAGRIKVNAHGV